MTPNAPVAFHVCAKRVNARTVLADPRFVAPDHVSRSVIAAVHVQAVAVALETEFFLVKTFLVGAQVGS
jgi:hypothetical protein